MRAAKYVAVYFLIVAIVGLPVVLVADWIVPDGAMPIASFLLGLLVGIPVSRYVVRDYYESD